MKTVSVVGHLENLFGIFYGLQLMGNSYCAWYKSPSGALYVFVFFRKNEVPHDRVAELGARCFVARGKIKDGGHVVTGIGMSEYDPSIGSASDIMYLDLGEWTPDDDRQAQQLESEFGFFHSPRLVHLHQDEYPT